MNFIRAYKIEFMLIVVSCILHSILFAVMVEQHGSVLDVVRVDDGYFELAQNVLAGNGFSWSTQAPYAPNPLRTPGYIYILAGLIGIAGVTGAAVIQLALSSLIPIFGMYIAQCITKSRKVGILTGCILAIDPTLALNSFQFYTDTFFLLFFLSWLLLTLQYTQNQSIKLLMITAVLLGIAILIRPVAQYVPLFIALCIIWHFGRSNWKKSAIHIGVYSLIIGTILTPWIIRNITVFDSPGLSAQASFVLYTNLAPAIKSVAEHTNFIETRDSFLTFAEYHGDAITLNNADAYTQKALEVVSEYPTATAFVITKSLFTFFTIDGFYTLLAQLGNEPRDFLPFLITARLVWVCITVTGFIGAGIYIFNNRTPWALFLVFLIVYFALTSTIAGFGTNPRYRLPVDPIILSLASIGALYIRTQAHQNTLWLRAKKMIGF